MFGEKFGSDVTRCLNRITVEPDPVTLNDVATPNQLAQIVAVDVGERRRHESAAEQLGQHRMILVRINCISRLDKAGRNNDLVEG